jgi:hypothetical protein
VGTVGAVDFYPATSGKVMAARHLMTRWGAAGGCWALGSLLLALVATLELAIL